MAHYGQHQLVHKMRDIIFVVPTMELDRDLVKSFIYLLMVCCYFLSLSLSSLPPPYNTNKVIIIIFLEPARFEIQSKNVTIKRGEAVMLDCTVIGDNPIEIQWIHNNDRLDASGHRQSISQIKTDEGLKSQLSIGSSDRQDSGIYRCMADNAYGRSEHLIYLAVQGMLLK